VAVHQYLGTGDSILVFGYQCLCTSTFILVRVHQYQETGGNLPVPRDLGVRQYLETGGSILVPGDW